MTMRVTVTLAALACVLGTINNNTFGQESSSETEAQAPPELDPQVWNLYERLEAQDARIQDLESRLLRNEQQIRALPVVLQPDNGDIKSLQRIERSRAEGVVDTHEEGWVHTWGGRIMGDAVYWIDQDAGVGGTDYFEFRRIRLFAEGTGYGVYDYAVELEFEPENTITHDGGSTEVGGGVAMRDMYVGIHELPLLGYARFGHFKTPFSLEELASSNNITFMERSLANVFTPGREVGMAAYNHSESECMTWAGGVFYDDIDDVGKQRIDANQGARAVGRVTWTPFYDEPSEGRYMLHIGAAAYFTQDQDGTVRFTSRPEIHEGPTIIDSGVLAADDYTVAGVEAAWVRGPLSVQGEGMWVSVDMNAGGETDLYGAYGQVSYFLTGEHRPYNRKYGTFGRVTPLENFWVVKTCEGRCTGWGAWEMTARWSFLDFNDTTASEQIHEVTAGINWYWNPHTRLMVNWIHPFAQNAAGRVEADIIATRLQVDF